MRKKFFNYRKIKKYSRKFAGMVHAFLDVPFIKPGLIILSALCVLLIFAPYAVTKFSSSDEPEKNLLPETSFELMDIPATVKVYIADENKTMDIDFEDYVKGVVSGEMPSTFHKEALKAQAVAARTYSLARVLNAEKSGNPKTHPDAPLCDTTHCQVYRSENQLEKLKGKDWMKNDWKKICSAVNSTKGQLLYYNGELVKQALFHSSSGGKTENSEDVFASAVPYLVSVESPYEEDATHQNEKNTFSITEFAEKIKASYPGITFGDINVSNIKIISRSAGGRVEKMQIGNGIIEGRNVREALALPSANFTMDISDNNITFTSNGSGHGVGMSQYGADGMAKKGYNYRQILNHYYSGTEVH